jgi:hypothetical protein
MSRTAGSSVRQACKTALNTYGVVIYAFVVTRLSLLAVGLLTQIYIRPLTAQGNPLRLSPHQAFNIWGAWDTGWYVDLALNGYQRAPGADGQANWAFFPAFPTLAAVIARATGRSPFEAMLAISNASFFIALILLHRLARAEFDRKTADIAVVLICVLPGSYIFSAAYTESLFLLCVAGCLLALRAHRWMTAGSIAAAAVLTRNLGLGLVLPYAWTALEQLAVAFGDGRDRPSQRARSGLLLRIGAGGLLPLAALLSFALYLKTRTGDALAFVHVQGAWNRGWASPLAAPLQGLLHPSTIPEGDLVSFAAAWLAIALLIVLASMRRWSLLSLALFLTLAPLATGLISFARYALVIAPLWLALAKLLSDRPLATVTTISGFAILNGFMMVAWSLALRVTA